MKKIRILIRIACLVLALAAALSVSYRVGNRVGVNEQRRADFSYRSDWNQYQRGDPMQVMDRGRLKAAASTMSILAPGIECSNVLELPQSISYFAEEDGRKRKTPVYELPKGTRVLWKPTTNVYSFDPGYGFISYPTYEKGWRYAVPFLAEDQKETDWEKLPCYFVHIEDLEAVAKHAFESTVLEDGSKPFLKPMQEQGKNLQEIVFAHTRDIDRIFYRDGVFCSPDLEDPVWHTLDTLLACLFVLFLLAAWLIPRAIKVRNERRLQPEETAQEEVAQEE